LKYIIGIGILFKKYKKKCRTVLHLNDRLIDEFDLDQDIENKFLDDDDRFLPMFTNKEHTSLRRKKSQIPSVVRLYEVDEKDLIDSIFKISIDLKDSNYTNGFLTKSALVKLPLIFLIPKNHLQNKGKFFFKILERYKDLVEKNTILYPYYFNKNDSYGPYRTSWPAAYNCLVNYRSDKGSESKKIYSINDAYKSHKFFNNNDKFSNWIGGEIVEKEFHIKKKFGIYMFCNNRDKSIKKFLVISNILVEFFLSKKLHKYIDNEN